MGCSPHPGFLIAPWPRKIRSHRAGLANTGQRRGEWSRMHTRPPRRGATRARFAKVLSSAGGAPGNSIPASPSAQAGFGSDPGPPAAWPKPSVHSVASPNQMKIMVVSIMSILRHGTRYLQPMGSFEIVTPKANRPGSGGQPKRHGAASIQSEGADAAGHPGAVAPRVSRFGCRGTSCAESVHGDAKLFGTPIGKHEALRPAELDQARVDGEPHDPARPPFAPSVVHGRDELTKLQ